jgi:hypothetical protein
LPSTITVAHGIGRTSNQPWIGGAGVAGGGAGAVGTTVVSRGEGGGVEGAAAGVDGAVVGDGKAEAVVAGDAGRGVLTPVGDGALTAGEAREGVGALSGTRAGGVATVVSGTRV